MRYHRYDYLSEYATQLPNTTVLPLRVGRNEVSILRISSRLKIAYSHIIMG